MRISDVDPRVEGQLVDAARVNKYAGSGMIKFVALLPAAVLAAAALQPPTVHAQRGDRTAMRVSAVVQPSCRIETNGSRTAAGRLLSTCGRQIVRVSVDGRPIEMPRAASAQTSTARVALAPGSLVQIDF